MRLDQKLVELGLARSRSQAKEMIEAGYVSLNGELQLKASSKVSDTDSLKVKESELTKYVSRAGLKLEAALERVGLSVNTLKVLDVGLSTGGFSDCLLQKGVSTIVGVDVGHNQLADSLKNDERLLSYEGVNAKELSQNPEILEKIKDIDLIVMDVSFISILKIIPEFAKCGFSKRPALLSLVKPQFELSKKDLNKQGLVKEESKYLEIKENIIFELKNWKYEVEDYFPSPIKGGDGNKEFFVYAKPNF
jgi:23S rRNA (cytidine1920-2'-O)/16S rRNA (cytidine1409-2'-O)-methyltransferase